MSVLVTPATKLGPDDEDKTEQQREKGPAERSGGISEDENELEGVPSFLSVDER